MALYVIFHNDGTGNMKQNIGNYDVYVLINRKEIWKGRVEDFHREGGWSRLVKRLMDQFPEETD